MIEFKNVSVSFQNKGRIVDAVKNVSFEIQKGEIFGIVGTSGAGKSTLLRTINLLQRPTDGTVLIAGKDITHFQGEELRKARLNIGMIFQQFNLINTKTVFDNVAFAMKVAGKSKEEILQRVPEVLQLVGLTERANAYPSTLSGGQKQRVGIARAVANNPEILLCDEATSALDLETTKAILSLLKEINKKLGITIVVITHEMDVIKEICDRVAVMSNGEVLELGDVFTVFASPQHSFTQSLVNHTLNFELPERFLQDTNKRTLKIIYNGEHAEEGVISETIKKFDIDLNILHGKIEYISNRPLGILLVQLSGKESEIQNAQKYIAERTYKTELIK